MTGAVAILKIGHKGLRETFSHNYNSDFDLRQGKRSRYIERHIREKQHPAE
jgi:hypothetical protein